MDLHTIPEMDPVLRASRAAMEAVAIRDNVLISACCKCELVLGTRPADGVAITAGVSHGLCEPCLALYREEMRAEMAE